MITLKEYFFKKFEKELSYYGFAKYKDCMCKIQGDNILLKIHYEWGYGCVSVYFEMRHICDEGIMANSAYYDSRVCSIYDPMVGCGCVEECDYVVEYYMKNIKEKIFPIFERCYTIWDVLNENKKIFEGYYETLSFDDHIYRYLLLLGKYEEAIPVFEKRARIDEKIILSYFSDVKRCHCNSSMFRCISEDLPQKSKEYINDWHILLCLKNKEYEWIHEVYLREIMEKNIKSLKRYKLLPEDYVFEYDYTKYLSKAEEN